MTKRAKAKASPSTTANADAAIKPEDFAAYCEDDLRELARRCETAPADVLKSLVEQSRAGAELLAKFGSVEEVVRPLVAVWGGDEDDELAAAA